MAALMKKVLTTAVCKQHPVIGSLAARCMQTNEWSPHATYGGRHTVTLIPADGVGPQFTESMQEVFRFTGVPIDFELTDINQQQGFSFDDVVQSIKRNGTCLKGNWVTRDSKQFEQSLNVRLRHELDMYANVVKCKTYPTVNTRHTNVDVVIIRENTEGEYTHMEHESVPGVVEMMKIITESSSLRIAKFAFDYAVKNGRKKVTCVHKANIMKLTDGLFLNVCEQVSKDYPGIEFEAMIVDNTAMQLVSRPEQFDVMVMPNLYGNIVTNLCTGLVGGPGMPAGSNHGDLYSMFETGARNSGKGLIGQDVANPMGYIFAGANMLRHLGLTKQAQMIEVGVHNIVTSGKARTKDIGGKTKTSEFFAELIDDIQRHRYEKKLQKEGKQ